MTDLQGLLRLLMAVALVAGKTSLATRTESQCMSIEDAQQVASNWQNLQSTYNEFSLSLAEESIAVGFSSYASSTNTLVNGGCSRPIPLNDPTMTSRKSFFEGQGAQRMISMRLLNMWHTCSTVVVRWRADPGPDPVVGITILEATPAAGGHAFPWLIETADSEFSSAAWLTNLGIFTPECSRNSSRLAR
ncbi:uncharacterized protein LTR77_000897 [Saxophila tyrrhenica]|uniref:NTF2-like domain-containing protein n=1 Tax=Saxophila tyrrhenica TaxID=1690608 RepID=A0AAV9PPM8_9PEZI|nr:hypothetical protein LTR77_000897 [Saxophila tyrrhenica]